MSRPSIRIREQPSRSLRFRYMSEGRPGTIPGNSSTVDNKTHFSIEILGYQGRVLVVVSCVSKESPHRPHPHHLVGQNCREEGFCKFDTDVTFDKNVISFPKIAVQCAKRNDAKESLEIREKHNIDPFSTGFDHKNDVKSIDLNVVRLCIQVFLKGERTVPLSPLVSDPIYNKKTLPDPRIFRLSHCCCTVDGGRNYIILLCTKINRDDITVQFFENVTGIWQDFASFHPNNDVYNNSAICFKPPKYHNQNITEPVRVQIQLVRPSDGAASPPIQFEYLPLEAEPGGLKRKRISPCLAELSNTRELRLPNPQEPQFVFGTGPTIDDIYLLSDTNPVLFPLNTLPNPLNEFNHSSSTSNSLDQFSHSTSTSYPLNELNQSQPSTSHAVLSFDNLLTSTELIDSDNDILQKLIADPESEMQPIHISSGELETTDVDRLSGTLQDNLNM